MKTKKIQKKYIKFLEKRLRKADKHRAALRACLEKNGFSKKFDDKQFLEINSYLNKMAWACDLGEA